MFDSLVKEKIITNETRLMIRTGTRLYYRDFFTKRGRNPDCFEKFEESEKKNLMFRILYCMLDGDLGEVTTEKFLTVVYQHPGYPVLLD